MNTQKKDLVKEVVTIAPLNFKTALFKIVFTAPYVQNKFSAKAREQIMATQQAGSQGRKGRKREPKDFEDCYRQAMHISTEGWCGIPASAFRNAMVDACRAVGFKMTHAKLAVFIEADGFDVDEGTPLVKIEPGPKGGPKRVDLPVRINGVCDIHPRPMWEPGCTVDLRVSYDADMFSLDDVANLLVRVGRQVGIGEGRPFSKSSCGMGWGIFEIQGKELIDAEQGRNKEISGKVA